METTMNNASPWTHFLLISPGVMSWRSVVFCCLPCSRSAIRATARRLLLVVKVVFVVFPNSAGRIGNSTNPITRFSGRTRNKGRVSALGPLAQEVERLASLLVADGLVDDGPAETTQ